MMEQGEEYDSQDDDFFDEDALEGDDELDELQRRRLQELQAMAKQAAAIRFGTYEEAFAEKELFQITTSTARVVVHFAHKEFKRCRIMDKHLQAIARKHSNTRFVKIDVQHAPFLVEKLKIQVLPCLVSFVDGVTCDRLLGFEGVTDKDEFPTHMLEKRLATTKVISLETAPVARGTIFGFEEKQGVDGSDDDEWDD